jgi:hypothetical protein
MLRLIHCLVRMWTQIFKGEMNWSRGDLEDAVQTNKLFMVRPVVATAAVTEGQEDTEAAEANEEAGRAARTLLADMILARPG